VAVHFKLLYSGKIINQKPMAKHIKHTFVPVFLLLFTLYLFTSCTSESMTDPRYDFDLQGHRGARGLLPENTIPSFLKTVDLGVDTIEFDVVVTADRRVLVSHEPWFHQNITTKPDGSPVTADEATDLNIYRMTYDETQQYDVGIRGNVNFPDQQPVAAVKPLMADAIKTIEAHVAERGLDPVRYNIETKSQPEWYGVMVPEPEGFARLLYDELVDLGITDRVFIQSFDVNTLIAIRQINPALPLVLLVDNDLTLQNNLDLLGFVPAVYSPNYQLVTPALVESAHEQGMKVIPWTINQTEEMRRQLEMGVDGIITDYPDRAAALRK
jgi:glycerophosphoryl diester phosphodiesterase